MFRTSGKVGGIVAALLIAAFAGVSWGASVEMRVPDDLELSSASGDTTVLFTEPGASVASSANTLSIDVTAGTATVYWVTNRGQTSYSEAITIPAGRIVTFEPIKIYGVRIVWTASTTLHAYWW